MPLLRKGGQTVSKKGLTKEQTNSVYDAIESGNIVNINNEIEKKETVLTTNDSNLYQQTFSDSIVGKDDISPMAQWSILSDNITYVQAVNNEQGVAIKSVDYRDHKRMFRRMNKVEGEKTVMDFGESPALMKNKYMDMYDEVFAEILTTNRFNENVDLSTTYLGKVDMKRKDVMKAEESFPITEQGYVVGKIANEHDCHILFDTGASKSYMSKSYYLRCKVLHDLPKFSSKTQRIQVGNGQYVGVLFVIPVIVEVHGHRLEVFTLVSEIFDNVDMVLGIKNIYELEGVIDSRESCFRFLNRSTPIFPRERIIAKPGEKKLIPIECLFEEEISSMAVIKIIDKEQKVPLVLKLKFVRNKATLELTNNTKEILIFDTQTVIGILDLRSIGYYRIKQGVLQQNLSKYYQFQAASDICNVYNKVIDEINQKQVSTEQDKYPWLDDTDERKYMTDEEILDRYINLRRSCLTEKEKKQVMELLYKYKDVFSLRDEIGTCPNIEVNIEVTDTSPFFIRPYNVKEEDRAVMDKEMKRLCYLGILREGFSAYSSPVMLISRKMTSDKRVVTDFRHLNMRIAKNNLAYPLLRDTFVLLGSSKCEVMSVLDLKDAFHSLRLSEKSQKFCGILPYFGSASYLYQRMPMGLNVSPPIWQTYINTILSSLKSRKYCEAIMDDLLLFTPNKETHKAKLEDLLSALRKNGLKISPKKCQLFRTELQYMGNTIFIKDKRVCVKPLRTRLEAIQQMKPPRTVKQCKSFAGMVNFVSIFCPELQKLLKPIYDLTRKGVNFKWGVEQENAFEEIKQRLQNPPILHMPDRVGRFQLYSDTSKYAAGGALYQIQNGKPKLIAYASKRLPEAAKNYSITELEMCGLAINIASFKHLLGKVDFDAVVDHLAITQIMRSKVEPATNRIKRLLEVLSSYSFNLYYIKGKDMILSDFLSRQEGIEGDPKEIIPISFSLKSVLQDRYYNIASEEKFLVQTRSQTKASGIRLPEVHGARKRLDPHKMPEKVQPPIERVQIDRKPRLGEGRAGLRRKAPPIQQSKPIVITDEAVTVSKSKVPRTVEREIVPPFYIPEQRLPPKPPDYIPEQRPPPKPPDITTKQQERDADLEIEENSPFQESIISEVYERPDKSYFQDPIELKDLINTKHIVHKFLPKQADIDRILDIIKRKVLKGTHLPLTVKEIQAGYLSSKYFKDIYQYLAQNRLPNKRIARKKVEMLAEKYILLDSLLFKIIVVSGEEEEKVILAIPESCADKIINLYHASLFGGHQGVIKTYLTISDKFFIPNLIHYLRSYIKGCHTCQLYKKDKPPGRQLQERINVNYKPLSRLSMDLKVMPRTNKGYRYILCVIDEVTNYIITAPIKQARSEEVGESLITNVFSKYCIPDYMIMDLDSAFMSSLMNYLFRRLGIIIKTVAPYNHQSLQAEHGIKSISNILTKHLVEKGDMWPDYLPFATLAYNTFNSPNLHNYSPYELVFGRKPKSLLNVETNPDVKVSATYKEYYDRLEKRITYLQKILLDFKMKRLALMNKDREYFQYSSGDLVYLISPLTSLLRTASRKIMVKYVGPLVVYKIIDPHNYLLMTLDGKLLRGLFEHERIKQAVIRTSSGNVVNLAQLKQAMSLGMRV